MTRPSTFLLRDVRMVDLDGSAPTYVVDVRVEDGRVAAVGEGLPTTGIEVVDAAGAWLMPGLWDAHVHLGQWAASRGRLDASAVETPQELLALVGERLAARPGRPVISWGHAAGAWPEVTVTELDAVTGAVPTVLVSGDAHQAWINTVGQRLLELPWRDEPVRETEWFDAYPLLEERIAGPVTPDEYAAAQLEAARVGIVGVTDFEFTGMPGDWPARHAAGGALVRVRSAVYPAGLDQVLAQGLRTGDVIPGTAGLVTMGPLKIIGDGSLNTRTAWCCAPYADPHANPHANPQTAPGEPTAAPASAGQTSHFGAPNLDLDDLTDLLARARTGGLEVAVHAIGDRAAQVTLEAFEKAAARGSMEHAQLIRAEDVQRMARLGVRASVQPAHLLDDRDLSSAVWPGRGADCFPLRRMLAAGVDVRLGSDAPVAPLDPWLAMAAAVHRSADARPPWHGEQALDVREALSASTDGWGSVAAGHPADLVLLADNPLAVPGEPEDSAAAARHLRSIEVVATWVGGNRVG